MNIKKYSSRDAYKRVAVVLGGAANIAHATSHIIPAITNMVYITHEQMHQNHSEELSNLETIVSHPITGIISIMFTISSVYYMYRDHSVNKGISCINQKRHADEYKKSRI